jgi:hypothetical protein
MVVIPSIHLAKVLHENEGSTSAAGSSMDKFSISMGEHEPFESWQQITVR